MSSYPGMVGMVGLLVHWLSSLVKSRHRLRAENPALRHQVNILRRRAPGRLRLSNAGSADLRLALSPVPERAGRRRDHQTGDGDSLESAGVSVGAH